MGDGWWVVMADGRQRDREGSWTVDHLSHRRIEVTGEATYLHISGALSAGSPTALHRKMLPLITLSLSRVPRE